MLVEHYYYALALLTNLYTLHYIEASATGAGAVPGVVARFAFDLFYLAFTLSSKASIRARIAFISIGSGF